MKLICLDNKFSWAGKKCVQNGLIHPEKWLKKLPTKASQPD